MGSGETSTDEDFSSPALTAARYWAAQTSDVSLCKRDFISVAFGYV